MCSFVTKNVDFYQKIKDILKKTDIYSIKEK